MFRILCVTNRRLCREALPVRIRQLAQGGVDGVILREKDLPRQEYHALAEQILAICRETGTPCAVHSFPEIGKALGAEALHLPLPVLRGLAPERREAFSLLGASCHSLENVREAARLGCSYVTLGHIFSTDCKKGLPPRGIGLLEQVCRESPVPVYAIGGISEKNIRQVRQAGAAGACVMSGLMQCPDPENTLLSLRRAAIREELQQ